MTTVLIHGFFRNKSDMSNLEHALNSLGHKTLTVNLPTTFGSMGQMVDSLSSQLKAYENKKEKIHIIAHSLGGLVARNYISHTQLEIGKCIFIATPHHGSKLANIAQKIPLFSSIFKPINELHTQICYTPFKDKNFKLGLIAGDLNNDLLGCLCMPKHSDARVEVQSVQSSDADDFIVLPYNHDKIHKNEATTQQILYFLENGKFQHYQTI